MQIQVGVCQLNVQRNVPGYYSPKLTEVIYMKTCIRALIVMAVLSLASLPALADNPPAATPMPSGPPTMAPCSQNPQGCDQRMQKLKEWCGQHQQECEKRKQEMEQKCKQDPQKCQAYMQEHKVQIEAYCKQHPNNKRCEKFEQKLQQSGTKPSGPPSSI